MNLALILTTLTLLGGLIILADILFWRKKATAVNSKKNNQRHHPGIFLRFFPGIIFRSYNTFIYF